MPTEEDKYFYFKQNQEKKIVSKSFESSYFPTNGEFSEMKKFISEMEEKFADKLGASPYIYSDYDGCIYFAVTWKEIETDDEFETRCRKEFASLQETKRKNREKNEVRRLKNIEKKRKQENLTNLLIRSKNILVGD